MNERNQLSDSEIQKLRDDLAEAEKRKWLLRLTRTGAAWIGGVVTFTIAVADAAIRLAEWVTKK